MYTQSFSQPFVPLLFPESAVYQLFCLSIIIYRLCYYPLYIHFTTGCAVLGVWYGCAVGVLFPLN